MRAIVQVNRSQYDAMPVVVLPVDRRTYADAIPIGTEVHVFTDAELRARDERIIKASMRRVEWVQMFPQDIDDIIAAAEADQ